MHNTSLYFILYLLIGLMRKSRRAVVCDLLVELSLDNLQILGSVFFIAFCDCLLTFKL